MKLLAAFALAAVLVACAVALGERSTATVSTDAEAEIKRKAVLPFDAASGAKP